MNIKRVIKRKDQIVINPDGEAVSYHDGDTNRFSLMVGAWVDQGGVIEEINKALIDIKTDAIGEVKQFATDIRAKLTNHADQYQLAGWVGKSEIAKRVIAGTASAQEVASIQAEVDKRGQGETVEELANKQLEKSIRLTTSAAIIDGMESAAITAIESTQTSEELDTLMASLLVDAESELNGLLAGAQ